MRTRRAVQKQGEILPSSLSPNKVDPRNYKLNSLVASFVQDPSQIQKYAGGNQRSVHQHHAVSALDFQRYQGRDADHVGIGQHLNDPSLFFYNRALEHTDRPQHNERSVTELKKYPPPSLQLNNVHHDKESVDHLIQHRLQTDQTTVHDLTEQQYLRRQLGQGGPPLL